VKFLCRAITVAGLFACALPARAAPIPFGDRPVTITAREEPIESFLRTLFGQIGRPVTVSPAVTGAVNGQFNGPPQAVFANIARAFNLAAYFDGAVVHIYAANEVAARSYQSTPTAARRTVAAIGELGLSDASNHVRVTSSGMLMAMGTPRYLDQVGEIARARMEDIATPGRAAYGRTASGAPAADALQFRVYYLRYARADDTVTTTNGRETRVPGVASILRGLVLDSPDPSGQSSHTIRPTANRLGGRGLASTPPDANQADANPRNAFYDRFDQFAAANTIDADSEARPPAVAIRIQANPALNAVIVRDAPNRMAAYDGLVRALDVEPQVVEVEATIIDLDTQRLQELGLNWNLALKNFNLGINNINPLSTRGANISTIIGNNNQFIAQINALASKNAARIVARPQVMTLSDIEAVFDRTQTFYVRVQGQQSVDLFNVSTGTVLRVSPHVFRDHNQTRIRLQLAIEDGTLTARTVDNIPVVERSEITTQALMLEGQSLLVGGLIADTTQRSREKIPVLGDVPILGQAFRNSRTNRARTERLFLITPRIAPLGRADAATIAAKAEIDAPLPVAPIKDWNRK